MVSESTSSLIHNAPEAGLFLDVGCGECDYTNILRSETRKIISLDIQKPQTPLACENTFVLGSVEHLPFKEDSFDFIYCLSVIQLIRDDRAAIEEIFRILKPGGKFYLTIPTRGSAFRVIRDLEIRFGMYKHLQFNVKHHHYYAKKDIEILIQNLFQMESVSGYRYNFVPRLLNLLLDILTMRKNVAKLYHSTSIPKAGTDPSYIWKNSVKEFSEGKPQQKNKILKPLRPLLWPVYGLAYHYVIVLKKNKL
ncbi:class I SAM-dependent methyltransferase [Methanoculleus sp.]|jgi:SAM-dependent methyltransferase|uniref:class I SAM-dependent methyltransferase n=1 Tax=Methanoculleus sp. TaxID=90427 RepID=UPI001BD6B949|nr:class I SAM-dependent methyltransferase [Methanoculleus sp.]